MNPKNNLMAPLLTPQQKQQQTNQEMVAYQKQVGSANKVDTQIKQNPSQVKTETVQIAPSNKITFNLDPNTRQLNIQAPQWYLDSPEFQQQVLPEFQKLNGRTLDDVQFKALINTGMQNDIQKQIDQLAQRNTAVQEYQQKFPKATQDDALTFYRNLAAFQEGDRGILVTGKNEDGTPKTQTVKDAITNFSTYDDKDKAKMLKASISQIEAPDTDEYTRATAQSLIAGLQEKNAFDASALTKWEAGLDAFTSKSDKGAIGWLVNKMFQPISWASGDGRTIAEEARDSQAENKDLETLGGVGEAKSAGDISGSLFTVGADIAATLPLGGAAAWTKLGTVANKIPSVASLAPKLDAISPAVANVAARVPSIGEVATNLNRTAATGRGVSGVAAKTVQSAPSDIAFGGAQALTNSDYNAPADFALNTVTNAGAFAGAKVVGRTFRAIDTSSGGALSRFSRDTGRLGLKGVGAIQSIPGFDKLASRFSKNFLDEDAVVKRTFRNAYAGAKGESNVQKAQAQYYEISNAARLASQKGAGEQQAFREENENFKTALQENNQLEKSGLGDLAADYVNKSTIYQRALAGQYQMKPEELQSLADEVTTMANNNPELVTYAKTVANTTSDITRLGTEAGILDEDIIKYMEDNPEFAKDYVALQTDLAARKDPYKPGAASPKNLKNTTPVRKIKGQTTGEPMQDPFLVMNQRLAMITRIKAENRVATIVRQGIDSGAVSGHVIRDAGQVKRLSELKFSRETEKEAVDVAISTQLDNLGGELGRLTDDLEDFAGTGQKIVMDRIEDSVDDMVDAVLDSPKLQEELTGLMDDLGEGKEGSELAAGLGILHRNRNRISQVITEALNKSELGASERKMVVDMFKSTITEKFDDAMRANGRSGRSGARELNARQKEISALNKSMGGLTELKGQNVVAYYENGHKGYYELDDAELADYFNSRKPIVEDGLIARFMTGTSRLFRAGTTGLDPAFVLFVNPLRDIPQAFVAAGTGSRGIVTPARIQETLMEARGLTREQATAITQRIEDAKTQQYQFGTQVSAGRGDVNQRNKKPWWQSQEGYDAKLDKQAYNKIRSEARDNDRGKYKYVINAFVPTRAIRNAEDILGNVELVTRSQVYNTRFLDALQAGKSVDDAMSEALFYGTETTSNFLNSGAKIKQFVRTVPYLMAAINGSASFTRLFALDPVGVTLRMVGGIAMPATYLTVMNLKDEETAQAYGDIPEYTRNTNFIIMLNKDTPLLIPMSYELARVVNPFREAVETHHGIDPKSFQDIMVQGLLSTSPIDIAGFGEKGFDGEVDYGRAFAQTAGAVLPQLAKPVVEGLTGRSMFTGAELNPSDEQLISTGQVEADDQITAGDRVFTKKDSTSLRAIADFTGIDQGKIGSVFSAYGGTVGQYLINGVDRLANAFTGTNGPIGGKDVVGNVSKRFLGSDTKQSSIDYYATLDKLQDKKEGLQARLERIGRTEFNEDPAVANDKRQKLIDAFGEEVSTAVRRYADYYNRVGGLKPYQVDDVIDLLDLGGENGTFAFGTYQNDDQQTVRQESKADANRRALELGLPTTAARDLYGQTELMDDGSSEVSYYDSTLANATIRDRAFGAPKQIAYEFSEIVKADRKAGVPSLYDAKKGYDDEVSKLYDEAKGLKGKAATAVYDRISDMQERYMEEVFDPRIRPLIEKYGAEVVRNSTVMKEISGYVEVPGDFTPFASKKKQPYLTDDVVAYLKDRYGVGNINERNLRNDDQSAEYIKQINANLASGNVASAKFQANRLKDQVDSGRIYVDAATMDDIAAMIKARNKR